LENIHNNKFNSVNELFGKKVAITKGSAIEEYVKINYPQINIIETKNELEALKLLNDEKVDAAIAENVRASYYVNKYNLNNITPGPDLGYDYYLSIASRNDMPMLNVILSKAVNHLPEKKLKALKLKWGYLQEKILLINKKTLTYIILAFIIIVPFLIYLYTINKKLKKEIKEKEEALDRIKKLRDSKLNHMSEILNMISHQWKQPLNNISLLLQLLSKKYKKNQLDAKTFEYFEQNTKKQIDFMLQTISDFKELFKTEETQTEFNLANEINNLVKDLKPLFEKENIKINITATNNNLLFYGYPNMLKQIILNILNNAKDALLENSIKNPEIKINLKKHNNKIIISIEDNAGGIPIDIIDKIFEPYFSTKKNKNGTGLGLYMAKIIVEEQMNGNIDVKNTKNGAIFEITLNT
jgi:signal transduction histidine kinase